MDKYRQKYRIKSTRLPYWDYGSNGYYFVTICTKDKVHWFGKVINCRDTKSCVSTKDAPHMALSPIGKIARKCWTEITHHFPFVTLDEFIVMPNHVHGIIIIDKPHVETHNHASLQSNGNRFGSQSKNLASIIRGYKIGVTKSARKINLNFSWQPRFHDHVIRNESALNQIRTYIQFNVEKWEYDRENANDIPIAIKRNVWKSLKETCLT